MTAFGPQLSRFDPRLFYWVFVPCDVVSLVLQGAGGALSSTSLGRSNTGADLALAGLALQVATLVAFCALYADYLLRLFRCPPASRLVPPRARVGVFYAFEGLAVVMVLLRCAFRVHEMSKGYTPGNRMLRREDMYIGLEGV